MSISREDDQITWDMIDRFWAELRAHARFLLINIVFWLIVALLLYVGGKPQYTATAMVGPSGPSPTDAFMLGFGGAGSTSDVARRVLGGGASEANNSFQEYMQILYSTRLSKTLIERDNILPLVFHEEWDSKNHRWRPPGPIKIVTNGVKWMLRLPVTNQPNVDALNKFLRANLSIAPAKNIGSASPFLASTYQIVSLNMDDPRRAEQILAMILGEADNLIREDIKRDVEARLRFLTPELQKVMLSNQRDAMIAVVSSQEQLRMMIEADQRFASTLIDPPYSSNMPSSLKQLFVLISLSFCLSLAIWVGASLLAMRYPSIRERLWWIERLPRFSRQGGSEQAISRSANEAP